MTESADRLHVQVSNWAASVMWKLFQEDLMCDTVIVANDGQQVKTHSCVLSTVSVPLHALLQKTKLSQDNVLQMTIDANTVQHLIKFIYTGEINANMSEVKQLHSVGLTLKMNDLTAVCENALPGMLLPVKEELPWSEIVSVLADVKGDELLMEDYSNCTKTEVEQQEQESAERRDVSSVEQLESLDTEFVIPPATRQQQPSAVAALNIDCSVDDLSEDTEVAENQKWHKLRNSRVKRLKKHPSYKNIAKKSTLARRSRKTSGQQRSEEENVEMKSEICQECGDSFENCNDLVNHVFLLHSPSIKPVNGSYKCTSCSKAFKKEVVLKRHMINKHSSDKPYACPQCPKSFATRELLKLHTMHKVHKDSVKPFVCDRCGDSFLMRAHLDSHRNYCPGQKSRISAICAVCGKGFPNTRSLKSHASVHTTERPHQCSVCNKLYKTEKSLRIHKQLHLAPSSSGSACCSYCGETFASAVQLYRHERTHHKEKEFGCTQCDQKFSYKSQLKNHEITHTSARPHQCPECDKSFKVIGDLVVHQRIHKGQYMFKCQYCSKGFTTRGPCVAHERTHTGDKPYSCKYCSKSFAHSATWRSHLMIHTGQKPYVCTECGMGFRKGDHLKNHLRSKHSDEKAFSCVVCDCNFSTAVGLYQHRKTQHSAAENEWPDSTALWTAPLVVSSVS